jgi:hypothetical protein
MAVPLIARWVGQDVTVLLITSEASGSPGMAGTLLQVDECGVLLKVREGEVFVPMTAIVHIRLAARS